MRKLVKRIWKAFMNGDKILLLLCLVASTLGCIAIASTTSHHETLRYLFIQIGAIGIGVIFYVLVSCIDLEFVSEHRMVLVIFNIVLLLLLIPFGVDYNSGNRSWLDFPFLPFAIQPAELCKITFILILASVMARNQRKISSFKSVLSMGLHLGLLFGTNMVLSEDAGVSLIFVFIFVGMAFAGGVHLFWFGAGIAGLVAGAPLLWKNMSPHQKSRIQVLFDPSIDPQGINERYHTVRSLRSLTGGGLLGQGLFNGNLTQSGESLPAQHTDYIFSAIGEEMGYVGCVLVLLLLLAIIIRCIQVGSRSQDYLRRLVCFGAATALMFQVCSNVGMCIGVTPVIGLTLPFISYGGSSIVSLYAMLGLVSGVYARPAPKSHERYITLY